MIAISTKIGPIIPLRYDGLTCKTLPCKDLSIVHRPPCNTQFSSHQESNDEAIGPPIINAAIVRQKHNRRFISSNITFWRGGA